MYGKVAMAGNHLAKASDAPLCATKKENTLESEKANVFYSPFSTLPGLTLSDKSEKRPF